VAVIANEDIIVAKGVNHDVGSASQPLPVLRDINLRVADGEIVAIVGPSGCGKTTFLNLVAGLERLQTGSLLRNGDAPRSNSKDKTGYMFARDALLPWRTTLENVSLPLEIARINKRDREARAEQALASVGLADRLNSYRSQLSQGMRQRVALARTLVTEPRLLLLDEPFGALDAQTRIAMQELLLEVLDRYRATVLLVTHDLGEAITLADRVVLFSRRPASVTAVYEVRLSRPRQAIALQSDPEFHLIYETIWKALGSEVRAVEGVS